MDSPQPAAPTVLALTEMGKGKQEWLLTLYPAHLALAQPSDERPYVILREQMMKSATLVEGVRALVVEQPRKMTLRLTPEAMRALTDWIGRPVLAGYYLRRRYGWVLPVAVLWLVGSLPLPGDQATGAETFQFDPVGFGLGLTLVASWACAKWRPHPALFLVDSLWFAAMAGHLIMNVLNGRSKGWLVLVLLLLWMVVSGLKYFMRFRGTKIERPRANARQ